MCLLFKLKCDAQNSAQSAARARGEEAHLVLAEAVDEVHAHVLGFVADGVEHVDVARHGPVCRRGAVLHGLEEGDLVLHAADAGHGLEDAVDLVGGPFLVGHVGPVGAGASVGVVVGGVGSERGRHGVCLFCGWLWILAYLRWCSRTCSGPYARSVFLFLA